MAPQSSIIVKRSGPALGRSLTELIDQACRARPAIPYAWFVFREDSGRQLPLAPRGDCSEVPPHGPPCPLTYSGIGYCCFARWLH